MIPFDWTDPAAALAWFTTDPTGQRAAIGLAVALTVAAGVALQVYTRRRAKRKAKAGIRSPLPAVACLAFGVFYALVWTFDLTAAEWSPAATIGLATGLAAWLIARHKPHAKPKHV